MNVTPLVDVVLVLLIIFMVVTPLLGKTFWLSLPKKDDDEPPPSGAQDVSILLSVDRTGHFFVNGTDIPKGDLPTRLGRMLAARGDKVVYFAAPDGVPYGLTVEAMDIARGSGAKTIGVVTEKVVR